MNPFLDVLDRAGSDPASGVLAVLLFAWVAGSVWRLLRCPVANNTGGALPLPYAERILARDPRSLTLLAVMVLGIGMAIGGLFGLAARQGSLPVLFLTAGLFVVLTLPVRTSIRELEAAVVRAPEGPARRLRARRLHTAHLQLVAYETLVFVLLAAIVLLF